MHSTCTALTEVMPFWLLQPYISDATEWQLAAACLNHRDSAGQPDCVGFTRDKPPDKPAGGLLWHGIANQLKGWSKMSSATGNCDGMYVKGKWHSVFCGG